MVLGFWVYRVSRVLGLGFRDGFRVFGLGFLVLGFRAGFHV